MTQRKLLILFAISMLLSASKCEKHPPPTGELCGYRGQTCGDLACNNPNLPDGQQDYSRDISVGDIVASPSRFNDMNSYCIQLRGDLIKCEKDLARCD